MLLVFRKPVFLGVVSQGILATIRNVIMIGLMYMRFLIVLSAISRVSRVLEIDGLDEKNREKREGDLENES